jgi:hypothetical protein
LQWSVIFLMNTALFTYWNISKHQA